MKDLLLCDFVCYLHTQMPLESLVEPLTILEGMLNSRGVSILGTEREDAEKNATFELLAIYDFWRLQLNAGANL